MAKTRTSDFGSMVLVVLYISHSDLYYTAMRFPLAELT